MLERVQEQLTMIYTMEDDFMVRSGVDSGALVALDAEWAPVMSAWSNVADAYQKHTEVERAYYEFLRELEKTRIPPPPALNEVDIDCTKPTF